MSKTKDKKQQKTTNPGENIQRIISIKFLQKTKEHFAAHFMSPKCKDISNKLEAL